MTDGFFRSLVESGVVSLDDSDLIASSDKLAVASAALARLGSAASVKIMVVWLNELHEVKPKKSDTTVKDLRVVIMMVI